MDWKEKLFEELTGVPLKTVPIGGRTIAQEYGREHAVREYDRILRVCNTEEEYRIYKSGYQRAVEDLNGDALDYALKVIRSYQSEIREAGYDEDGFCQGVIFKEAIADIENQRIHVL